MRLNAKNSSFLQLFCTLVLVALATFALSIGVNAQTVTFAQFSSASGGQDYVFTNNTTSGAFDTVVNGAPVDFKFLNVAGLPPSISGFQSAHLFVTTTTTVPATLAGGPGGTITQPFSNSVTVQIIRDTPAPVGIGANSRTNLLTAVFSASAFTPSITGSDGGTSATLQATTPNNFVTFTSDFLGFGLTTTRNMSFSFSSVNPGPPGFVIGSGGFVASFTAAGSGTFASNPVPVYLIPSAAPVSLGGRLLTPDGNGLRNAQVILTEANGAVHQVTSSAFGYFNFPSIESGQNVVVSVRSKQFQFTPQLVSLNDNVADLQMTAR